MSGLRPIPGDAAAGHVEVALSDFGDDWLLLTSGDVSSFAVEAFKEDGSAYQRLVCVEVPVRHNHQADDHQLRLAVSPDDAMQLAAFLVQSAQFAMQAP